MPGGMGPVARRRPLYVHLGNNLWKIFEKGAGWLREEKGGLHKNFDVSFKFVEKGLILQTPAVSPVSFVFSDTIILIKLQL